MQDKNITREGNITTKEGYEKLKKELELLKTVKRPEVAKKIKEAKEFGDLSENSEYEAALDEQVFLEKKIVDLENSLKNVKILEISNDSIVDIGKTVTLTNIEHNETFKVKIVGTNEASPLAGLISMICPVARAILNKKEKDTVKVATPTGEINYRIDKVELI